MVENDIVRTADEDVTGAFATWRSLPDHEREIIERFLGSFAADPTVLDAGCGGGTRFSGRPRSGAPTQNRSDSTSRANR